MKEIFVSLSGAMTQEKRLSVVANNLANINTVGFKKDFLVSEGLFPNVKKDEMLNTLEDSFVTHKVNIPPPVSYDFGDKVYCRPAETLTDYTTGPLKATGNPLDVAIDGEGFFKVQTPDNQEVFTRKGNFMVNSEGVLVTQEGHKVLGDGNREIKVTGKDVGISTKGEVVVDGKTVGTIGVFTFERKVAMEKLGDSEFKVSDLERRDVKESDNPTLAPAMLEMSNVNGVKELVTMIDLQHAYNAYTKAIKNSDEMSDQLIRLVSI